MSVFDDPRGRLRWLEEELLEEEDEAEEVCEEENEEEEIFLRPRRNDARNFRRTVYADEEPIADREAVFIEKKRRKGKGNAGLKFLIFLEILGILAVIWWWIQWLY